LKFHQFKIALNILYVFQEFQAFVNDSTDIMNAISSVTGRFSQTPYGMPDIRAAFHKFDTDGSLSLDPAEFKEAIRTLGCDLSELEVHRVLGMIDTDGDGLVGYEGKCYHHLKPTSKTRFTF
jgi:Ca2+-binding EF-hand superfamily protein